MLCITIDDSEFFDDIKEEFITVKKTILKLEHSLYAVRQWEQKYKKPYLGSKKTADELLYYIKCMTINPEPVPNSVYSALSAKDFETIDKYIDDKMTATVFKKNGQRSSKKGSYMSAELIYYSMFTYQIPIECERWHLNQLLTLIHVFDINNSPNKTMSKGETARYYKSINQARQKAKKR